MIEQATPTIDINKELMAPKYRQEAHEIPILPSTINLEVGKPRPMTHTSDYQMRGRPINSLAVRQGNSNPAMAGIGDASSTWALSQEMIPGMGAEEGAEGAGGQGRTLLVLAVGAGLGYLAWKMSQGGLARL